LNTFRINVDKNVNGGTDEAKSRLYHKKKLLPRKRIEKIIDPGYIQLKY